MLICKPQGSLPQVGFFYSCTLYHNIVALNLKIGMPRSTQVDGQTTGLLPLFVIKWTYVTPGSALVIYYFLCQAQKCEWKHLPS